MFSRSSSLTTEKTQWVIKLSRHQAILEQIRDFKLFRKCHARIRWSMQFVRKIRDSEMEKLTKNPGPLDIAKKLTNFWELTLFCLDFRFWRDHSLPLPFYKRPKATTFKLKQRTAIHLSITIYVAIRTVIITIEKHEIMVLYNTNTRSNNIILPNFYRHFKEFSSI